MDIFGPKSKNAISEGIESQKLDNIIESENQELLKIRSQFPFDLIPTTVVVNPAKITITFRPFFFTKQSQSILISDIMTIIVEETLLLSSLRIISRLLPEAHIVIPHFSHVDANRFREVVGGLMVANENDIDLTKIKNKKLGSKLREIGQVNDGL